MEGTNQTALTAPTTSTVDTTAIIAEPPTVAPKSKRSCNTWTSGESAVFFEAAAVHGRDWSKIGDKLESKTKDQIRHYYYRSLRKIRVLLDRDAPLESNHDEEHRMLICYWELRRKLLKADKRTQDEGDVPIPDEKLHKSFGKLLARLLAQGTTTFTKAKRSHRLNVQKLLDAVDGDKSDKADKTEDHSSNDDFENMDIAGFTTPAERQQWKGLLSRDGLVPFVLEHNQVFLEAILEHLVARRAPVNEHIRHLIAALHSKYSLPRPTPNDAIASIASSLQAQSRSHLSPASVLNAASLFTPSLMDMLHEDPVNTSFPQTSFPATSTFIPTTSHTHELPPAEFTLSGLELSDEAVREMTKLTAASPAPPATGLCEAATSTVERNTCSQPIETAHVSLSTPEERAPTQADLVSGKRPRVSKTDSASHEPIPKIAKELQPNIPTDPDHSNHISPSSHSRQSPPVPLSRAHLSSASTPSPSTLPDELSCVIVAKNPQVEAAVKQIGQKPQLKMAIKTRKTVKSILLFLQRHFTRKGKLDGIDSIRFFVPDSHQTPLDDSFSTGFSDDLTILRVWQLLDRPKHFELAYSWPIPSVPSPRKFPSPLPLSTTMLASNSGPVIAEQHSILTTPDLQLDTPVLPLQPAVPSELKQGHTC
eukprot:m.28644 g.28644  ORF g.28644 m.28644 type:complete len:650 (+) comp11866_c0_seq1:211-2160(+)